VSDQPSGLRGRQAEAARNDLRVLDAAREIFAAHGASATVAAIADRAGVGMGSLYRRYGSKDDLMRRLCILAMEQSLGEAEAGLQADDPLVGLIGYIRGCVALGTGALAPLAGTIDVTAQMVALARRGQRALEALVTRAHETGGLRPDVTALDIAGLVELFGRGGPMTADDNDRQRLLAIAVAGLRSETAEPLPAPAPSARTHEQRWKR